MDAPIFVVPGAIYHFDEYTRVCNAKFPGYINMRLGYKAALGCTSPLPIIVTLQLSSNNFSSTTW